MRVEFIKSLQYLKGFVGLLVQLLGLLREVICFGGLEICGVLRGDTGSFLVEPFSACLDLLETLRRQENRGGECRSYLLINVHLVLCPEVALSDWIFVIVEGVQLGCGWSLSLVLGLLLDLQRGSWFRDPCPELAWCESSSCAGRGRGEVLLGNRLGSARDQVEIERCELLSQLHHDFLFRCCCLYTCVRATAALVDVFAEDSIFVHSVWIE